MHYWLFKSEPNCFSIDDLAHCPKKTNHWDGVRNYQARNMLRDQIKVGDLGFFYHSSCDVPGVVGVVEVVRAGYPDFTAWDIHSEHFDPKSTLEAPRWYMVDLKLVERFPKIVSLALMKQKSPLKEMVVLRKGNRLSITPITPTEWRVINDITKAK